MSVMRTFRTFVNLRSNQQRPSLSYWKALCLLCWVRWLSRQITVTFCSIAAGRHIWCQTLTCLTSASEPHKMDYGVICSWFPNPRSVSQRLALLECTTLGWEVTPLSRLPHTRRALVQPFHTHFLPVKGKQIFFFLCHVCYRMMSLHCFLTFLWDG